MISLKRLKELLYVKKVLEIVFKGSGVSHLLVCKLDVAFLIVCSIYYTHARGVFKRATRAPESE